MSRAGLGLGVARTLALGIGVLALGGLVDAPADPARPVLAAAVALVAAVACEVAGRMLQDAARRRIARDLRLRLLADPASQALPEEGDVADLAVDGAVSHATYRAEFRGGILAALVAPLVVLALVALAVDGPLAGWLLVCLVAAVLLVGGCSGSPPDRPAAGDTARPRWRSRSCRACRDCARSPCSVPASGA
jgi:ABC-type transport system involved in cytochrome bd biosynthesis fused ATPase/permease subunit